MIQYVSRLDRGGILESQRPLPFPLGLDRSQLLQPRTHLWHFEQFVLELLLLFLQCQALLGVKLGTGYQQTYRSGRSGNTDKTYPP